MTIMNPRTGKKVYSRKAWRRHKPDRELTASRYGNRIYLCKSSFVDIYGDEYLTGGDMEIRHDAVMTRDKFKCVECGATTNLQVHHVQHKGRSGSDNIENLATTCVHCHRKHHPGVQLGRIK